MTRPILLDTCATMWLVDDALRPAAVQLLLEAYQAGRPTFVSPFTAWEIGGLAASGKFRSTYTPDGWIRRAVSLPGIRWAELSAEVLLNAWRLPGSLNRDPADRIIAATAREYDYIVMTRDRDLLAYAKAGHLHAFEC